MLYKMLNNLKNAVLIVYINIYYYECIGLESLISFILMLCLMTAYFAMEKEVKWSELWFY